EGLSTRARNAALDFARCVQALRRLQDTTPVGDLIEKLLEESGYMAELRANKTKESDDRIQNIHELLNTAKQFEQHSEDTTLRAFLETLALATDLDTFSENDDAVTLMTLHSAKGLEFPVVFLVGLEEGLFPLQRGQESQAALEEERRLCYVGITRAKERLYLSHAGTRMIMGSYSRSRPSRFLTEMRDALARPVTRPSSASVYRNPGDGLFPSGTERARRAHLERSLQSKPAFPTVPREASPARPPGMDGAPAGKPGAQSVPFKVGDRVRHKVFGIGLVVQADRGDGVVNVAFEGQGIKKLQLGIAPIEKV
ncbi:MAG TPA: 3'-5' exonuclease, partial [Armatimonadota bacterium]|nr:3'-5' exonuclease [Armatimonadota bacterium]